jgi:hypothetical protein
MVTLIIRSTYLFLVFRRSGFISTDFMKPKAYSIGALACEYGAEMQIEKPRAFMWLTDSLQVW